MKSLQVSRKTIKLLYSKMTVFFLLLAVLFMFQSVWRAFEHSRRAKEKELATVSRLVNLETQHKELIEDLDQLKTKRGIERVIRQDFMMSRPGEKVIAIIDEEDYDINSLLESSHINDVKDESFWDYLFFWK